MVLIHGYYFLHSRTCGKQKWNLFYLGSSKYSISNLIIPRLKMYHMSHDLIAISAYLFDVKQTCYLRQKRVLFAIIDFNQSFGNHEIASRNNYQDSIHPLVELRPFWGHCRMVLKSFPELFFIPKTVFIKIHVGNHSFIMCNFLPDD